MNAECRTKTRDVPLFVLHSAFIVLHLAVCTWVAKSAPSVSTPARGKIRQLVFTGAGLRYPLSASQSAMRWGQDLMVANLDRSPMLKA